MSSGLHARKREDEAAHTARTESMLRAHRRTMRAPIATPEFELLLTPLMLEWRSMWIRRPEAWRCQTRSQDLGRRSTDLLRHLFQAYPVPPFLEAVWANQIPWPRDLATFARAREKEDERVRGRNVWFGAHPEASRFIPWYIAAANGMSVYKECASGVLSRQETHLFLHAPDEFLPSQNIWWARARGAKLPRGIADNVARSKLRRMPAGQRDFWMSVLRFFGQHPGVGLHEMEDLLDFLVARHAEQPGYTLKGRSLASVREASIVWHRLQIKRKEHGASWWTGAPLPDWEWSTGRAEDGTLVTWRVRQIRKGSDLVDEGQAQHHCVGSYKERCMRGDTSIWSMTRQSMKTDVEPRRTLTVEVHLNEIVQARGFANRIARSDESGVLDRWASDAGLDRRRYV